MKNFYALFILVFVVVGLMTNEIQSFAQTPSQTIRGVVKDAESDFPLTGATVLLMKDSAFVKGNYSDENGNYRFDEIAVGRYSLHITYVGYMEGFVRDIILSSGKESVIDVHLESSAKNIEEIVVSANKTG
ncbi:MAG: carboxypeptidase-like regulatory domain-containing protein, partial [Bacteroidota bacterium]